MALIPNVDCMVQRQYTTIEAPSILGLRSIGVDRLAECLLQNDLAERLNESKRRGRLYGTRIRDGARS
jgi:hypothetical protein